MSLTSNLGIGLLNAAAWLVVERQMEEFDRIKAAETREEIAECPQPEPRSSHLRHSEAN